MPPTVKRRRLSDRIADRIRRHILDHRLQPGDRLPTEHELADAFGASRLAVREATKALGFLGIVQAAPRRGLTVGQLDLEQVAPFLEFHPALRQATMDQLIDTRIVVETGGLPLAMQRMRDDPSLCERLFAAANEFHRAKDVATWIELDIDFHRLLLSASGLAPLVAFHDLLDVFFRRFRESVKKAEWKQGIESHLRILEALREGQLQVACGLLRRHIESHRLRMESPS